MPVTIRDLARMANTSVATVSRVMNQKPGVAPDKRANILQLAKELGYQPNRSARALASRRSHLFGFVGPDLRNPLHVEFLGCAGEFCKQRGFQTMVVDSERNVEKEIENVDIMLQHRAEGLIIFPVSDWHEHSSFDHFLRLKLRRFPFVLVGRVEGYGFDCVYSEEFESAKRLVQHLIGLGHRRFGLLGHDPLNRPARERYDGIRAAMEEAALTPSGDADPGKALRTVHSNWPNWGHLLEDWLTDPEPPTALIAMNSGMALIVYRPLGDLGYTVPEDVSLVAFDDAFWCSHIRPALTVSEPRNRTVSELALDTLIRRIEDPAAPPMIRSVPQDLIFRESVGVPSEPRGSKLPHEGSPLTETT